MVDDRLKFAQDLAREAGSLLKQGLGGRHSIHTKSQAVDLVTEFDLRSEQLILERLHAQYEGEAILSEESGARGESGATWVVDPLDGTTNFAHGMPIFSVSIAYTVNGRLQMGVVFDPMRDEMFYASAGQGAFLNGQRLQVSDIGRLDVSLMVTGFPYEVWVSDANNLDHFRDFALRTHGVRRTGSAALDLAYVAAGRFEGYWEISVYPWDWAAGALLVREAGGRVTQVDGTEQLAFDAPTIVASNGQLHEQMLAVLAQSPGADGG